MSDRLYPIDIHGCAQGIITFSLQQRHFGTGAATATRVLRLDARPHVGSGERVVLLPAAPAIPDAHPGAALVPGLDVVGARQLPRELRRAKREGIPRPRAVARPRPQQVRAAVRERCSARRPTGCASGCGGCCRPPRARTGRSWTPAAAPACSASSWPNGTRKRRSLGVDSDPDLVARANEIATRAGLANCSFQEGDVTKLGFDDAFDLVVSVDNLEHVEDDIGAMRTLLHALRPGGRLVVHVPGYERRWILFGRRVNFDVPGHVRPGYRAEELVAKLQDAGFEVSDPPATPTGRSRRSPTTSPT